MAGKKSKKAIVHAGFSALLADVKGRIQTAQTRAVFAVNTELVRLYWDIGRIIAQRQRHEGWGATVIPRLALELHNELPELKGFSERNIKRMLAFYREYPTPDAFVPQPAAQLPATEKVPQVAAQSANALFWSIPWFHHIILMEKVKDLPTRRWYMKQARQFKEQVFEDSVEQIRGRSGLPLKDYQSEGLYPVIDQGQTFIAGHCDDESRLLRISEPVVVWGDHTTNVKLVEFNFVPGADGTKVFLPKEGLTAKFLFHFLQSVEFPELGYSRHYRHLKQVLLPIPPLSEQLWIVEELDRLQVEVAKLKTLQAQTSGELDALLPSILDKAFRGDL